MSSKEVLQSVQQFFNLASIVFCIQKGLLQFAADPFGLEYAFSGGRLSSVACVDTFLRITPHTVGTTPRTISCRFLGISAVGLIIDPTTLT